MDKKTTISIIVPVVNECEIIYNCLNHLTSLGADEIIVVDAQSNDGTREIIQADFPCVKYIETPLSNRSIQMNEGASESDSEVFIFVHSDMRLPSSTIDLVRCKIHNGFIAGGFKKCYDPSTVILKIYQFLLNTLYLKLQHCLVGSNAIFVTREQFKKINGFPKTDLLEDVIFSKMLKKYGRITVIDNPVIVSARRYISHGIFRQIIQNLRIIMGYTVFHESTEKLSAIYKNQRERRVSNNILFIKNKLKIKRIN